MKLFISSFVVALIISFLYFIFNHSLNETLTIFLIVLIVLILRNLAVQFYKNKKKKK